MPCDFCFFFIVLFSQVVSLIVNANDGRQRNKGDVRKVVCHLGA